MEIISEPFRILDHEKDCFRIRISGQLTGAETTQLRSEVAQSLRSDFDIIYIDAKELNEIDLSGINEVIHSHYTAEKAAKKIVFLYKKDSPVDTWVQTTALDKFVATAVVPAN